MDIRKVMVVGAGIMGNGIAQVCAENGLSVVMNDVSDERLQNGLEQIRKSVRKKIEKQKLAESEADILSRIVISTELDDADGADFVIEAATEKKDIKFGIFRTLDQICPPETILASNTSSISITEIAAETKRQGQVIGMHFMNPVPLMPLVEIIPGLETSEATLQATKGLTQRLSKTPAVANDYPGFVSNRIFLAMMNEAFYCVYEGVGEPEEIDKIMTLGFNHPMGPLRLADLVGLDTLLNILEVLWGGYRDSKYKPCPLLVKMVKSGRLGQKSGQGFYSYR